MSDDALDPLLVTKLVNNLTAKVNRLEARCKVLEENQGTITLEVLEDLPEGTDPLNTGAHKIMEHGGPKGFYG